MFETLNMTGAIHTKKEELVETIELLKAFTKGELELDLEDGQWYAMDYREEYEGAFSIEHPYYGKNPLISEEIAKKHNIDVRLCCDDCSVAYVG